MHYYLISPTKMIRQDADSFVYSFNEELRVGTIVKIEIGKISAIGVVLQKVKKPEFKTKDIINILYTAPLPLELVQTALWIGDYYSTHMSLVWQTLLPRGIDKKRRTKKVEASLTDESTSNIKKVFTKDQQKSLDIINSMSPGPALVHGVTGSGKTLVYIEAAKSAAKEGLSSIILVPEIALTSQLVMNFLEHFDNIILSHSKQTESERHQLWEKALHSNDPLIVIGPRSALFTPVQQLGLVVIDEFHEPSLKQEQSPKYSALRAASILTSQHEAKLLLGSATPPVAEYYLAQKSSRPIITLPTPARKDTIKPVIEIIDMTKRNNFNRHHFISDSLIAEIENSLKDDRQVLIFHNRRGTAPTTLCQNCGWQAGCPNCFIPLTLHADNHQMVCHICAKNMKVPTSCPECANADIIHKGIGTKLIESEISHLFPNTKIARFDGDSESDKTVEKQYKKLKSGEIQIIIGTQVIAKGLDLPKLNLVGIIQADAGLALPDFSSTERTFQLLAQVVGRVGRANQETKVIAQSYQPDHPALQNGLHQNYTDFYKRTLNQRKATNFPPFVYLLKLVCTYKTEATAIKNSKKLAEELKKYSPNTLEILGPTPAFYERVHDTYRWQIVVKSPKRSDLVNLLQHIPVKNWQYELDPTTLL